MPPGRVAPNGGTRRQGGAVQIDSERAGAGPDCERADCDTNNAASLKEARVDHSFFCLLNCFVLFSETQLSPSVSSGPTIQPEGSPTSGPVTKLPTMQSV